MQYDSSTRHLSLTRPTRPALHEKCIDHSTKARGRLRFGLVTTKGLQMTGVLGVAEGEGKER